MRKRSARGVRVWTALLRRRRAIRLRAPSSPRRSVIPAVLRSSSVTAARSCGVSGVPGAVPRATRRAARRWGSGNATSCAQTPLVAPSTTRQTPSRAALTRRPSGHSAVDAVVTPASPSPLPGRGKAATVHSPSTPRSTSSPRGVTRPVARPHSAPAATAPTVCSPSASRFQLNSQPKPPKGRAGRLPHQAPSVAAVGGVQDRRLARSPF